MPCLWLKKIWAWVNPKVGRRRGDDWAERRICIKHCVTFDLWMKHKPTAESVTKWYIILFCLLNPIPRPPPQGWLQQIIFKVIFFCPKCNDFSNIVIVEGLELLLALHFTLHCTRTLKSFKTHIFRYSFLENGFFVPQIKKIMIGKIILKG